MLYKASKPFLFAVCQATDLKKKNVIPQTLVLTCSDAVVRLMGRDVVDAVVFPWQH